MAVEISNIDNLPIEVIRTLNDANRGFFHSYGWYSNFIYGVSNLLKNNSYFLYQNQAKNALILPLMLEINKSLKIIKSLSNYYSPIFSLVGADRQSQEEEVCNFLTEIKNKLPAWHVLELRPLAVEECDFLLKQFEKLNLPALSFFCFGNWYLPVNGRSFEEYFSQLPSQLRNTVSRKKKKFFQLDGARVEIITSLQNLEQAIECYEQVYRSSWKVEEPFPEFMPGLIRMAASQGALRLGIAYIRDKPIAAQVWIIADNAAYIFKLAYDEAYKQHSAGTILTTTLIEYVIDVDKVGIVDYLSGDDAYKKDWMSHRRERWGILVFNIFSFQGCMEYMKEISKRFIKRFMRFFNEVLNLTKMKNINVSS